MKVEAEALDTSLTQRGSQWPVPSAVLMRAVEENEAAYGLNTIRARPVSLVQVGHALVVSATEPRLSGFRFFKDVLRKITTFGLAADRFLELFWD